LPRSAIVVSSSISDVEMILDRALAAPGDEDHLLDPRLQRLIDRILDQRPVDDRQHLLGHRLGGGQETRAKAPDGEYGLAQGLEHSDSPWRRLARSESADQADAAGLISVLSLAR
jgi:hypothetical protein